MNIKNEKASILIITMFTVLIISALVSLIVSRSVKEKVLTEIEKDTIVSFYASHGGTQLALSALDEFINDFLKNTVANSSPSGVINFTTTKVSEGDGIGWLVFAVRDNNTQVLTQVDDRAVYQRNDTLGNTNYQYTLTITEKTDPLIVAPDIWDFPFIYEVESKATEDGIDQNIVLNGDFTVRVQKDNFAKYALFTNTQSMPSGTRVWFTNSTNFSGPIHTNDRFNIALNPSGIFQGNVDQEKSTARYYNNGWSVLLDADYNGTKDVPTFEQDFNRDVNSITLSTPTQKQDMIDQAGAGQSFGKKGIYIPNDGTQLTGGIYIKGNGSFEMSVNAQNNASYKVTQGNSVKIITVDRAADQTTIDNISKGTSQTYSGIPNGVEDAGTIIYVDGRITSLKGTVQEDTELTIGSDADIIITDHLQYSQYSAAVGLPGDSNYVPPHANGTSNLLGLVSWNGDVRIGTSAPDDVNIHGTILAQEGIFQVDDYTNTGVGPRGTATLLGGVITDNYGAFGLFSGSTGAFISGYGRNFVYDQRMDQGKAPPYFPSLNTFIVFTNDITDKMVWQRSYD